MAFQDSENIIVCVGDDSVGGTYFRPYDDPDKGAVRNQSLTVRSLGRSGNYPAGNVTKCPNWYDLSPAQVAEAKRLIAEFQAKPVILSADEEDRIRRDGRAGYRDEFIARKRRAVKAYVYRDGRISVGYSF